MGSKGLSGTLPSDLNQLSQLVTLSFQDNSLFGALPSLANLQFLQEIYLDGNNFTSIDKDFFTNLTSLQTVSLGDNIHLAPWSIPDGLIESKSLAIFYASNVKIQGSIPGLFGSMPSLKELRLSYNNLTGSLPSSLSGTSIQKLWINNQATGVSGTIDILATMTDLTQVWLQQNAFTGPIPDLSNCTQLFDLQLRDNQFSGIVPSSLMNLPQLVNVSLRNNKLQGPLPQFAKGVNAELDNNKFCRTDAGPCDSQVTALLEVAGALGYPTTLADSWPGNNACDGWLSISCDSQKKNVTIVNFAKKGFTGTISPAFANLTSLQTLILSDNKLTGSIPKGLTGLTQLQVLDVSNNNLTGEIPTFRDGVKVSTSGNLLLGNGTDNDSGGSPSSDGDSKDTSGGSSNGSTPSAGVIVAIVVAVIIFIGVVLFVSYKCYVRKRHQKFGRVSNPENGKEMVVNKVIGGTSGYGGVPTELQSQSSGDHSDLPVFEGGNIAISVQVLRQVTGNFSEDNILGRGGFGVVYKGELHDGTKIAVKRMESAAMGTKGMNEFEAEIAVLTKVRHRHLVALLGFCVNGNERLLVYEYMPQGTLGQHLFDWRENGYSPLTWKQRVSIALDVGRGVEYLHSLAQQSFIHRDLKPSNILLGDDMRAKVADFGLVKNAPDGKYSVETRLAGTFGYLAPEYAGKSKHLIFPFHCSDCF